MFLGVAIVRLSRILLICLFTIALSSFSSLAQDDSIEIVAIAHALNNPRGLAVMPDGQLLLIEAGTGSDSPGDVEGSGRILQMIDLNNDGDFDDADERIVLLDAQPSYNSLALYRTGHDEPFGLSDIYLMEDGGVFFTLDNPFAEPDRNSGGELYYGNVGIFALNTEREGITRIIESSATLNSFAYDSNTELFYVTESGYNRVMLADRDNNQEVVVTFPDLAHEQQPVPSGIAIDPTTGDLLVTLFSGFVYDYFEQQRGFMPGDSKLVRYNLETGELTDELTGLTTAIDVAVSENGTIFVVELTSTWEQSPMPSNYDLFDRSLPPDPGGYARYTGRVTMIPVDGEPLVIAEGLDAPTNITYHDGVLYVSTGLGTPGRLALSHRGINPIEGVLYRITGF